MTYNPSPDEQHDKFYKWVGICITEWANVDHELFMLCGKVLNIEPQLVSTVYYSTPSIEGRKKLADRLLGTLWHKKPGEHNSNELTNWKSMYKRIDELRNVRNILAHGVPSLTFNIEAKEDDSWSTPVMRTGRWENLKTGKGKSITQDEMKQHSAAVHALFKDLLAFRNQLGSAWPEKWLRPRSRKKKQVHRQRRNNNVVVLDPKRR